MPIQSVYQLFGPVQKEGSMFDLGGPWHSPGAAASANTKNFYFQYGYPQALSALFKILWVTTQITSYVRLVKFDYTTPRESLFQIQGTGRGAPDAQSYDFTTQFNELVTAGQFKELGYELWDDGVAGNRIYEVRLEIVWASS